MRQGLTHLIASLRAKLDRFKSKRSEGSLASREANESTVTAPPPPDIASDLGADLHARSALATSPSHAPAPQPHEPSRKTALPSSHKPTMSPPALNHGDQTSGDDLTPAEKPKRRISVDSGIVVVALGALTSSLFFFFGDGFLSSGQHGDLQPVGHLSKSHSDVRRKVDGGLTWGTVASADKVYEGDSIFTGEGSDAVIELNKGGSIAIDPKSLIVIRTQGSDLEVDLQYGSLEGHVENNQPLLLKQGGEVKKIESKNAQIRIVRTQKSHKTTLQVVSGELKVQNKIVAKNEVVELEKDQAPVITKVHLSLTAPISDQAIWLPEGQSLGFAWTTDQPDADYTIEFSRSTSFEHPVFQASAHGTKYQLPQASLPKGDFYWRVRPTAGGLPSLPSRLTTYLDIAPSLVTPADNYVFTIPNDSPTIELPLSWEDTAGSTTFNLQIATDSEFKTVIFDEKTKLQRFKTKAIPQGHYSWRVKGLNEDRRNSPWSRSASFVVSPAMKPLASPLISPIAKSDWHYVISSSAMKKLVAPLSADQTVKSDGLKPLTWTAVPDAVEYQVEQARTSNFANASSIRVTDTSYVPDEVRPGDYFIRVRAKDKSGRTSETSEVAHLEVALPAPKISKIKDLVSNFTSQEQLTNDRSKQQFKLTWTPQPFASSYELEWGADPMFSRSKTFRVKTTEKEIVVTRAMSYAARVRALGPEGTPITPYSEVVNADYKKIVSLPKLLPPKRRVASIPPTPVAPTVSRAPPPVVPKPARATGLAMPNFGAPILREPQAQSSLISLESSPTFVDFKWRAVAGSKSYVLEIAQDADFQNKIAEVKVEGVSYVYQKPLPEGHIFWRVRCQAGTRQSEWSDVADLKVIYQ